MKVHASAPRPSSTASAQPFSQLLAEAKAALRSPAVPPGLVRRDLAVAAARVQQAALGQARVDGHLEAARLRTVRSEAFVTADASVEARVEQATQQVAGTAEKLVELIVRELSAEPPRPVVTALPFADAPQAAGAAAGERGVERPALAPERTRAVMAAALIERVERFLRSGRPGLELTLNNGLAARVELERVGPGAVAVKLVGRDGPPTADAVARVREELRARGLKVAALSVA